MDKKVLVRKLNTLKEDKDLSVFDQFNSVNEKLRAINGVLKSINIKEVKTYQEELKTLENAILSLTESVKGKDMVVNIPLDQLSSKLDQVENAIKNIKEVKIPDFPNFPEVMSLNEVQVNELLLAIQSIPEFPKEEISKLFKSLEAKVGELKLEAPENEFDYDFLRTKFDSLIKAIKGISISVSGSGFPERSQNNLINIQANQENHICSDNTTSTPLGANATFTGVWQDCLQYQEVNVSISTDQNSATDGLIIEWSDDADCICDTDKFTVYANAGTNYTPNPAFRYVRLKYTNGVTPQTKFNLMTILRRGMTGGSFHRITDTLKDDSDARLNITVPKLRTAANTYVSQSATTAGNAKMSLEELETGVSDNNKTQLKTSMYGKTGDTTFQVPRLDRPTHTLQTIDYAHHEIHAGSHFYFNDCITLANNGVQDYLVTTPDTTKWSHMSFSIEGSAITALDVYEATDKTGTTAQTIFNNDRNSATTSVNTIHKGTSGGTTDGTKIWCHKSGSATQQSRSEASSSQDSEIILKQNTKYIFRITSGTNDNLVNIKLSWYEHTNRTA